MRTDFGDYELDDDPSRIDVPAAWSLLEQHAYWGRWRSSADFDAQVRAAWRVSGAYLRENGQLVGFARAFSDTVATAYLADVVVDPEHRGAGLGVAIVDFMIERGPGNRMRWMLHTQDAHGLYARFGFVPPADGRYLERAERR